MGQKRDPAENREKPKNTENEKEQIRRGLEPLLEREMDDMEAMEARTRGDMEAMEGQEEEDMEPAEGQEEDDMEPAEAQAEDGMGAGKVRKKERSGRKKKGHSWLRTLLVFLVIVLALFFGGLYLAVGVVYDKMNIVPDESVKGPVKKDGVTSVLLIGSDSRMAGTEGRSDAMILITVSDCTKTVHMTSLLRDMYVDIPGHDGNRLNAAYAYGGAELLMETVNRNFGTEVYH